MTVSLLAAPDPDAHFFADFFLGGGSYRERGGTIREIL